MELMEDVAWFVCILECVCMCVFAFKSFCPKTRQTTLLKPLPIHFLIICILSKLCVYVPLFSIKLIFLMMQSVFVVYLT